MQQQQRDAARAVELVVHLESVHRGIAGLRGGLAVSHDPSLPPANDTVKRARLHRCRRRESPQAVSLNGLRGLAMVVDGRPRGALGQGLRDLGELLIGQPWPGAAGAAAAPGFDTASPPATDRHPGAGPAPWSITRTAPMRTGHGHRTSARPVGQMCTRTDAADRATNGALRNMKPRHGAPPLGVGLE
jgi:hypothetical protein